ncbi:MAG TPA: 16S rRNA (adenine(1518)-N(6)/adenine(1519)-N(6))-dimethyltransferase RsmA [Longimicrobiales bacterium]|nr:16S rRNA (adenine(1518)-N(6)/adenine(1519)-N(6))-dimethyltransferase RsmA [Longimicrobiales bacterium]
MSRPKRSLGQNFLVDPNLQRKIVDAVEPGPSDTVVEIGPGRGALTDHLVERAGRVVAVEKDHELAAALAARYGGRPAVEIVQGDALEVEPEALGIDPAATKVVGNLPYNITTPLLFRLLEPAWRPRLLVVMIQREVAERIQAEPGGKEYGALSVGIRAVARVEWLFDVGRGAFRPVPNVDSAVIRITPMVPPPLTPAEERDLRDLTRAVFGQRRKQLQKVLRTAPGYGLSPAQAEALEAELGVDLTRRPEELDPLALVRMSRALRRLGRPRS